MRNKTLLLAVLILAATLTGCTTERVLEPPQAREEIINRVEPLTPAEQPPEVEAEPEPTTQYLTIVAMGDLMVHMDQIWDAETEDGGFDFTHNFAQVKGDLMEGFAIGNLETDGLPAADIPATGIPPTSNAARKTARKRI